MEGSIEPVAPLKELLEQKGQGEHDHNHDDAAILCHKVHPKVGEGVQVMNTLGLALGDLGLDHEGHGHGTCKHEGREGGNNITHHEPVNINTRAGRHEISDLTIPFEQGI